MTVVHCLRSELPSPISAAPEAPNSHVSMGSCKDCSQACTNHSNHFGRAHTPTGLTAAFAQWRCGQVEATVSGFWALIHVCVYIYIYVFVFRGYSFQVGLKAKQRADRNPFLGCINMSGFYSCFSLNATQKPAFSSFS